LIIEISYFEGQWDYPTDEAMGTLYYGPDSYFELFKIKNRVYLIRHVDIWGEGEYGYMSRFFIIDNEVEAIEKFLEEVNEVIGSMDIELETCKVTKELKITLTRCKDSVSKTVLRSLAEKIIQQCEYYQE